MKTTTTNRPQSGLGARLRHYLTTGIICLPALLAAFTSVGCQSSGPIVPTEAYVSKPSGSLAPGDSLNITYAGAPEMNTKQKIQPNGNISLPTVGDVPAAGRSINSLQSSLTSLYQSHLQDPTVVVSLEAAASGVYVAGQVLRPGKVPLDRPMTALEAVMEAGGFTNTANPKQVVVVRKVSNKNERYMLNMSDTLSGSDSKPFYVRPFDVIYVKQSNW